MSYYPKQKVVLTSHTNAWYSSRGKKKKTEELFEKKKPLSQNKRLEWWDKISDKENDERTDQ